MFIRVDNDGENEILQRDCIRDKMGIKFEYTSRITTKHNGVVERKYQTLYNRLRATLNESTLDSKNKGKLWGECAFCVTNLENICVDEPNKKSPYEIFYGRKCKIVNDLRKFGEIGVVKVEYDGMVSKLKNKGKSMMMCGYSLNHSKGVYRMYDFDTEKICISRDIKWLGLMYKDCN